MALRPEIKAWNIIYTTMKINIIVMGCLWGLCMLLIGGCSLIGQDDRPVGYFAFRTTTEAGELDHLWGIMREDGEVICSNTFEYEPRNIADGRFSVEVEEGRHTYYMLEPNPRAISGDRYAYVTAFEDGVAVVAKELSGPWSIIDKQGFVVVPELKYQGEDMDEVWGFSDGYALFRHNGLYGFIDRSGAVVVEPKYIEAIFVRNGLTATIDTLQINQALKTGELMASVMELPSGRILSQYASPRTEFTDQTPLLKAREGVVIAHGKEGEGVGLQDLKGEQILKPQKDWFYIWQVLGELLVFEDNTNSYGLADRRGRVLIPAGKYRKMRILSTDRLLVFEDWEYFIIDLQGRRITARGYDDMEMFMRTVMPNGNVLLGDRGQYYLVSPQDGSEIRTELPIVEVGLGQFARDYSSHALLGYNFSIME